MEARAVASRAVPVEQPNHKRTKSSSVLKSLMTTKNRKRTPSDGIVLKQPVARDNNKPYDPFSAPLLPPNHPHASERVLGEISNHSNTPSVLARSSNTDDNRPKSLHKKTLSSVSLRSMIKEKEGTDKRKEDNRRRHKDESLKKPKKSKSSASISAMFSKSRSVKEREEVSRPPKDKENATPPNSAAAGAFAPEWAEFTSQPLQEVEAITTSVPLNDQRTFVEEIALYTPSDYTPSKQRNFHDYEKPTLSRRGGQTQRPKSMYLPTSASSSSFMTTLSRKTSNERTSPPPSRGDGGKILDRTGGGQARKSSWDGNFGRRSSPEHLSSAREHRREGLAVPKRGSRVMAAVAAFDGKAKEADKKVDLDTKKVDAEFEAVLESRNIPENLRPKMRALTSRVKADFIKSHKDEASRPAKESSSEFSIWAESAVCQPEPTLLPKSSDINDHAHAGTATDSADSSPNKRSRPRSKTFTFSKGDVSPSKKHKAGLTFHSNRSSQVIEAQTSSPTKSLSSHGTAQGAGFFSRTSKSAVPEDFVSYLRKVRKPEVVEVGKLHKLRLLLRNETVAWVDAFIKLGGMTEIVALLHRIIQIEWREEHEDHLLHEALLCLKGLCTTDLALQELCEVASTLFPALLAMLFDQENKGPSEFTTRGIITNLLFTYLSSAPPAELTSRARTILLYLADPRPPEDARPIHFILEMHRPRPYRIWCKEVVNVTKEVFWIFLHHLNVVPMPTQTTASNTTATDANTPPATEPKPIPEISKGYTATHFPRPRPPVPAAPYVGGVEWDATNYLSSHLDLLNGLLASLPTLAERNALRTELRASGFEKVMGGSLRTCKEKFYGAVHDGLRTWVGAAAADRWDVKDVRMGGREEASPRKGGGSPKKEKAPQIEAPRMDLLPLRLGLDVERGEREGNGGAVGREIDGWI